MGLGRQQIAAVEQGGQLPGVLLVDGIDVGIWKCKCRKDGEAPGTGAQVQHPRDALRVVPPRREFLVQQLGNERARHDDAFVGVKAVQDQPRFIRQMRQRLAR